MAEGPPGGQAFWLKAADGVRLRAGLWQQGAKGTVLLFPGRTEYIEKYGRLATDLAAHGYSTIAIDWRGQGLADHLAPDPLIGHVNRFADFQKDVAALLKAAQALALPKPFHLMAHSMGGCIGLRALMNGLPVKSAVFSAPMWGIGLKPHLRPAAWVLTTAARLAGRGSHYAPGTGPVIYTRDASFADNSLTTDPDMWAYMCRQVTTHAGLALGGPSMTWVNEALWEMARLRRPAHPDRPGQPRTGGEPRRDPHGKVALARGNFPRTARIRTRNDHGNPADPHPVPDRRRGFVRKVGWGSTPPQPFPRPPPWCGVTPPKPNPAP